MMQKTSCIVNKPFSANQMYVPIARGKMVKSKKYNAWIEKNLPILINDMLPAKQFPVNVELLVMANHLWRQKNDIDIFGFNCLEIAHNGECKLLNVIFRATQIS
jgi:hypothetical protein